MKSVRVVAVGLLLGGFLMVLSAQSYFHQLLSALGLSFVQTTLDAFAPLTTVLAGHPETTALVNALVCTGVGLLVSSVFYGLVEDAFEMVVVGVPALLAFALTAAAKFVVGKIRQRRRVVNI